MGRATRWFKSLLSTKKDNKDAKNSNVSEEFIHKEKKRWSFKSGRDSNDVASNAAWLKSINIQSDSENDQNRHAIAVAAATAAAADAAVLAAQAAVEVVRLTSQGRRGGVSFVRINERVTAAVKIQKFFRAYLAKKALRALKALVKLQALVRGFLVRKQAAKTLLSMQALIRAQASVRAHKSRVSASNDRKVLPEFCSRRSLEMFDEKRSEQIGTFHSHRLSGNLDNHLNEKSPKIVEIDTCRPKSRSSQSRTSTSVMDSLEDMSLNPISVPEYRYFQNYDWCRHSYTAQSTPRCMNIFNGPPTPTKSVNLQNSPSYMNSTQSFEAKVRSQSTPRQRPELIVTPRKKTPLTEVLFESRGSLSGIGMQRSCVRAQVNSGLNVKKASIERLDRSLELSREFAESDYYRKW